MGAKNMERKIATCSVLVLLFKNILKSEWRRFLAALSSIRVYQLLGWSCFGHQHNQSTSRLF